MQFEPELKRSTLRWKLTRRGTLQRIGRGLYTIKEHEYSPYIPEVDKKLKTTYNQLKKAFPFLDICIWHTRWLNEFMNFQPARFYILVEVEHEAMEFVFYHLQDQNKSTFLPPSGEILQRYAIKDTEYFIVKKLVSQAPTQTVEQVMVPTLEKILVDVFADNEIFSPYQGQEQENIFREAIDKYLVDKARMLRYAGRRRKQEDLKAFLPL